MKLNTPKIKPISEKAFQAQVVELAKLCGWWCYHTYDSRKSQPGFPDLVLIRAPVSFYAELKSEKGKLSPEQEWVIAQLKASGQIVHVWKPSDWKKIERILARSR